MPPYPAESKGDEEFVTLLLTAAEYSVDFQTPRARQTHGETAAAVPKIS